MGRQTLDSLARIDIRDVQRRGHLDGEEHPLVSIAGRSALIASVQRCYQRLVVTPWMRDPPQVLALEWTPCHYGGMRPLLRCPRCTRRCVVLYVVRDRLYCRYCLRLPYRSQSRSTENRQYDKLRALRRRVNAPADLSVPIDPALKPRYMHYSTWLRLCVQATNLHRRLLDRMDRRMGRLLLRHDLR
jgi:hypothetical protein